MSAYPVRVGPEGEVIGYVEVVLPRVGDSSAAATVPTSYLAWVLVPRVFISEEAADRAVRQAYASSLPREDV